MKNKNVFLHVVIIALSAGVAFSSAVFGESAVFEKNGIAFIPADEMNNKGLSPSKDQLAVQFTGAGGVYLATKGLALMADPFYSNPGLGDLLLLNDLVSDESLIDQWIPNTDNVAGILVGHGHYDHLMDVPAVLERLPAAAKVYASDTSIHMIASKIGEQRGVALNRSMVSPGQRGQWVRVHPRIKIFPIEAEHSPHLAGIVFADDVLKQDTAELPGDALDWQSGTTLSYVIDILDEDEKSSLFRIFYQSSSSGFPVGAPPEWLVEDGVPVDLAILCMANFDSVDNYPKGVLNQLKPKHVLLTHWEVFWEPYLPNKATVLPGLDVDEFIAQARSALPESSSIYLPQRGASVVVHRAAAVQKNITIQK